MWPYSFFFKTTGKANVLEGDFEAPSSLIQTFNTPLEI